MQPNRLAKEKSPYLLQHAYNPVDWFPWGDEAFEKAKREGKPIFLSIGYSTCHWCHVMEKESFEDPDVAKALNEAFICIKIDREERPDLDNIYMTVCQLLTGSGGWPLTIIMTPDRKPFFAGTYFPKESRLGRVGLLTLISRIKDLWNSRFGEVIDSAEKITDALRGMELEGEGQEPDSRIFDRTYRELAHRFDGEYGGFGPLPKFPSAHNLLFLLRYWKQTGESRSLAMVEKTLSEMRRGGIYDHVGFGFHRYSTDREWFVPHFEKMLYDQAMLSMAYLEAYQATGKEAYKETAEEVFSYVSRDMTSPEGAFYSAEDADSEGIEGKYYLWTEHEIRSVLDRDLAELLIRTFDVQEKGNYQEDATGRRTGNNILRRKVPTAPIADEFDLSPRQVQEGLRIALVELLRVRETRIRPHKDDKILTDWNGLMVASLAKGEQVIPGRGYAAMAGSAAGFVLEQMYKDGMLLHRYRSGEAGIGAHLDDYAFFVWGLVELYGATFEPEYLKTALDLTRSQIRHFWDDQRGGFFLAPDDAKDLIVRKKELYDGAIPSGNSVSMLNLLRLARMTGDSSLEEKASIMARSFSGEIQKNPAGFTQFLCSLMFLTGPSHEIIMVGPSGRKDTTEMLRVIQGAYLPNGVVLFRPSGHDSSQMDTIAPFLKNYPALEGKATVYVCSNYACKRPTTQVKEALEMLGQ
ncbi:MAG: thioredoxin domain-containing protein [Deltaproteobacteria bacterium]|nr:thioredoxin domain-containing protein [Deltaproteobacteria bacterium]